MAASREHETTLLLKIIKQMFDVIVVVVVVVDSGQVRNETVIPASINSSNEMQYITSLLN